MRLFNVFKQQEEIIDIKEEKEEKNVESISLEDDYLTSIDVLISRLTLINISHGNLPALSNEIKKYESKIEEIKRCYSNVDINDTSIKNYQIRMEYLTKLSNLIDEINDFSIPYLYKEKLNVIKNTTINEDNIEEVKKELLDIEKSILSKTFDKEVANFLYEELYGVIYNILKKENIYSKSKDLYDRISDISRVKVDRIFLKKLVKEAEKNKDIKEYIDKNDIGNIRFDYSILDLLYKKVIDELKTKPKVENEEIKEDTQSSKPEVTIYHKSILDIFGKKNPQISLLSLDEAKTFGQSLNTPFALTCEATDFAMLLNGQKRNHYKGFESTCDWYLATNSYSKNGIDIVTYDGTISTDYVYSKTPCFIRPVIKDKKLIQSLIPKSIKKSPYIATIQYGEYPQNIVPYFVKDSLDICYDTSDIYFKKANTKYHLNDYIPDIEKKMEEFVHFIHTRYIRFFYEGDTLYLPDERVFSPNQYIWIEVNPVDWIIDIENYLMVSSKAIFGGISIEGARKHNGILDLTDTNIYKYLNNSLKKDLVNYQKTKKLK